MQGKKIDEATCQKVIDLWMNHNHTQHQIVEALGLSDFSVRRIINEYTSTGAHAPDKAVTAEPERKPQINEEFDAAVDQMIEESKNEDTKKDTLDTKSDTPNVPDAVIQAVADKIETLSAILSDNLLTIKKMQQDNEQIRSELAVLYGWRAEHEGTEN